MPNEIPKIPNFRRWLFPCVLGWAMASPVLFLILSHLLFGIPVRSLLGLWFDETIVYVAASPMLYWSARRVWLNKASKALAVTVGAVVVVFLLVIWRSATTLGVITTQKAHSLAIVSLLTLPLVIFGGYLLGPQMARLPERFRAHSDEESRQ